MIHLWVDPRFGNDQIAEQRNPGLNGLGIYRCQASDLSPVDVRDNGAPLLHASWPYKTITAAVAYVKTNGAPGPRPLPYTSQVSPPVVWKYAIIHCLPGVYSSSNKVHPDIGIRGNGEPFPVKLPPNVSLQGTSVLNTLFDQSVELDPALGGLRGPFLHFGVYDGSIPINGENTFVSGISFTGARLTSTYTSEPREAAAVFIDDVVGSRPTIVNCWFFANALGVVVSASYGNDVPIHDGTTLMNNTFFFNKCALWNGEHQAPAGPFSQGRSRLILINNVFDAGDPQWTDCGATNWGPLTGFAAFCFEGVAVEDMVIIPANEPPGTNNFNAWEGVPPSTPITGGRYNTGSLIAIYNLTSTRVRDGANQPTVEPSRDISYVVGTHPCQGQAFKRGVLYLRDIGCASAHPLGIINPGDQEWWGDLRLSPATSDALDATNVISPGQAALATRCGLTTPAGGPNPLVDNGWGTASPGDYPVTMANGLSLTSPPGSLTLVGGSQNTWTFHALRFDGEGYGNPRAFDHPAYPNSSELQGIVDIGADELGDLIIGGYRYGTTAFVVLSDASDNNPHTPRKTLASDRFHHFGLPDTMTPPMVAASSQALAYSDPCSVSTPPPPRFTWCGSTGGHPFAWQGPWRFDDLGSGGHPLYAYYDVAVAEVTPHLPPDIHPWWNLGLLQWASNPIWQHCQGPLIYNPTLYWNPTEPIINPPGAFAGNGQAYRWLDFVIAPSARQFPWLVANGSPRFDEWCRGPGANPLARENQFDQISLSTQAFNAPMVGVRYTLEANPFPIWPGTYLDNNLQSFAVTVEAAQVGQ